MFTEKDFYESATIALKGTTMSNRVDEQSKEYNHHPLSSSIALSLLFLLSHTLNHHLLIAFLFGGHECQVKRNVGGGKCTSMVDWMRGGGEREGATIHSRSDFQEKGTLTWVMPVFFLTFIFSLPSSLYFSLSVLPWRPPIVTAKYCFSGCELRLSWLTIHY